VISEKLLKLIRIAEHPSSNDNEANVAAVKFFQNLRTECVSLSDVVGKASVQNGSSGSSCDVAMLRLELQSAIWRERQLQGQLAECDRLRKKHWDHNAELRRRQATANQNEKKTALIIEGKDAEIAKLRAEIAKLKAAPNDKLDELDDRRTSRTSRQTIRTCPRPTAQNAGKARSPR
jgi:hypothetical protein